MVSTTEDYKQVIDLIRQKGLIGHTFSRKDTKCYRIVIKDLHHTTPHDAIIHELEKSGNKVRGEIINHRYGPEKIPTSTFFVNLEPCPNNKMVKSIQYIHHQRIKIEDPRKSRTIVQCQRCQQYGHSKNNCMRPYRCVKCGEGHKTSECPKKDRNSPAKCALCSCDHPANYKGCQVYKEILSRKMKPRSIPTDKFPVGTIRANTIPESTTLPQRNTYHRSEKSYSDIVAGRAYDPPRDNSHQNATAMEQLLIKQNEKIDLLLQQISSLMGLLTNVITKLAL